MRPALAEASCNQQEQQRPKRINSFARLARPRSFATARHIASVATLARRARPKRLDREHARDAQRAEAEGYQPPPGSDPDDDAPDMDLSHWRRSL